MSYFRRFIILPSTLSLWSILNYFRYMLWSRGFSYGYLIDSCLLKWPSILHWTVVVAPTVNQAFMAGFFVDSPGIYVCKFIDSLFCSINLFVYPCAASITMASYVPIPKVWISNFVQLLQDCLEYLRSFPFP